MRDEDNDGDDVTIEFVNVTAASASSDFRVATMQAVGVGAVGADGEAERFDDVEFAQPAGLFAVPETTGDTEAIVVRRGDEAVALVVIDKSRPPQSVEAGETRLYGVGGNNSTAVIRIRADGSIEITATTNRNLSLTTAGTGDVVLNGGSLKVARATDPVDVGAWSFSPGSGGATLSYTPPGGTSTPITAGTAVTGKIATAAGASHVKA